MADNRTDNSSIFDLVLKGGQVIDPANNLNARMDVGISAGKIVRLAADIPASAAAQSVDVSGLYVTPGILDIHTHVYPFQPSPKSYVEAVHPDAHLLASGVTTTVDAGTAGWKHFLDFKEATIDRSKVRILAFINIACCGMVDAESEQRAIDLTPTSPPAWRWLSPTLSWGSSRPITGPASPGTPPTHPGCRWKGPSRRPSCATGR